MAASEEEELLDTAARDGSLDASKWPALLEQMVKRLDHIVYHEFPIPVIPPPPPPDMELEGELPPQETPQSTRAGRPREGNPIERVPPSSSGPLPTSSPSIARNTPSPSQVPATSTPNMVPNSQQTISTPGGAAPTSQPTELPPPVRSFYRSIIAALRAAFPTAPPFTIQRLAELVRHPRQHYKTLPAYLRALDRAVAVSSPATSFPLPALASMDEGGGMYLAGGSASGDDFNAAALTRIPWLKEGGASAGQAGAVGGPGGTGSAAASAGAGGAGPQRTTDLHTARTERIDGPHGAGSVETVTVGNQRGGFVGGGHLGTPGPAVGGGGGGGGGGGRAASQHIPPSASTAASDATGAENLVQAPTLPSNAPDDDSMALTTEGGVVSSPPPTGPGVRTSPGSVRSPPSTTVTSPPSDMQQSDDVPHARGPQEIGMADTGPQVARALSPRANSPGVADAENALGRPGEAETVKSPRMTRDDSFEMEMDVERGGKEEGKEKEAEKMDVEREAKV